VSEPEQVPRLPLAAGVGLCRALAEVAGLDCRLKWPNDVMVGNRKLGGVLIETVARGEQVAAAIVGFGVNHTSSDALPPSATSLAASGSRAVELAAVSWALVVGVLAAVDGAADGARLLAEYRRLSAHRPGDQLVWQQGDERVEGTFLGFDDDGHLRLGTGDRERRLHAGEVVQR
jgi:BirA family biotin operon repressor/biotin-[acetyl-CoA-carboxylase] ligase